MQSVRNLLSVCHVVNIAKQAAQLCTAILYAGSVPEALFNRDIIKIP